MPFHNTGILARHVGLTSRCGGPATCEVYARFIPNRTRRDGSAFAAQMAPSAVRRSPVLVPSGNQGVGNFGAAQQIQKLGAEGGI